MRIEEKHFNDKYWESSSKKPVRKNFLFSDQYNTRLDEMIAFVVSLVVEDRVFEVTDLKAKLNKQFKPEQFQPEDKAIGFVEYCEKLLDERRNGLRTIVSGPRQGQNYKPNSLRNPGTTLTSLKSYVSYYGLRSLGFEDINLSFYLHYRNFILSERKNTLSTFATRIKDIKAFMNEAYEDKLHSNEGHKAKRFITPSYDSDAIYLTLDEIKSIKEATIPERYHHVRDMFLIACYSALRFSDFSQLTITDIDDRFIRAKQNKTESRVTIPIMKELRDVLAKYENGFPKTCSMPHFNRTIKEIAALDAVGIDRAVGVDDDGNLIMWSSMISSHTGRRSYATNMFKLGIPNLLIMSATGHKKESDFLNYIKATNEDRSKLLAEWMDKLNL
ncbi:site-specific integrase [Sphingobacterium paludis]|nr:site-specific integrase [Sphingobacterium paludis]